MNVEVSELSNMLPELVQRAGGGETIVVTNHGQPVARLVPYDTPSTERGLIEGWTEPARRTSLGPAERHRSTESVLEVLGADRS